MTCVSHNCVYDVNFVLSDVNASMALTVQYLPGDVTEGLMLCVVRYTKAACFCIGKCSSTSDQMILDSQMYID